MRETLAKSGDPLRPACCQVNLFDLPVSALTLQQALTLVMRAVEDRQRLLISFVNAAKVVNMRRDPSLRAAVLAGDLILPDGMSLVWASRLLRRPLPERVTGIDFMEQLLQTGGSHRYRFFFLGATSEVLLLAVDRIRRRFPDVCIVGFRDGYFNAGEEPAVADRIRQSGTDVLLVGMSSPKTERFLARWVDYLGVPVCLGVGGAFDVLAGKVNRAPKVMQKLCLEWLYRTIQEPRRLWRRYLVTNTLFCALVLGEMRRRKSAC